MLIIRAPEINTVIREGIHAADKARSKSDEFPSALQQAFSTAKKPAYLCLHIATVCIVDHSSPVMKREPGPTRTQQSDDPLNR